MNDIVKGTGISAAFTDLQWVAFQNLYIYKLKGKNRTKEQPIRQQTIMRKYLAFIFACAVFATSFVPAFAEYLGPNPEARIYTVSSGTGTSELQADNATASHTITCLGTTGVENWCNDYEEITITGIEPKPGNSLNGAEFVNGMTRQTIINNAPPYVFSVRNEGNIFADYWVLSTVGDTSEMYEAEFKIDITDPEAACEIVSTPEYGEWYVGTLVIQGASADSVSGIYKETFTAGDKTDVGTIQLSDTAVDLEVSLTASDYALNESTITCATVSIDNTDPVIDNYTQFTDGEFLDSTVNFTMSAHDDHSGLQYMSFVIDGAEYEADESGSIEMTLEHGLHSVYYKAVDNVGNVRSTDPLTFYVDVTAPVLTIDTPEMNGKSELVSYGSEISGTASDVGGGFGTIYVEYPGSNGFVPASYAQVSKERYAESGNWSVTLPDEGPESGVFVIGVKAEDIFGNMSEVSELEVLVDVTKPSPLFALDGEAGVTDWYTGAVTIRGVSSDEPDDERSGVMKQVVAYDGDDGSDSQDESVTVPASFNGVFSVTVTATDYANNTDTATTQSGLKLDNTAPELQSQTVPLGGIWIPADLSLSVAGTDAHSGVQYVSVIIDSDEHKIAGDSGTYDAVFDETGDHEIQYKVVDNVNIATLSDVYTVSVDADKPEVSIDSPTINGMDNLINVGSTISGTVTDAGSGIDKMYIMLPGDEEWSEVETFGDSDNRTWNAEFVNIHGLDSGYVTVKAYAVDIVGNKSDVVELDVLLDVSAPKPGYKFVGNQVDDWYSGPVTIENETTDEHSGVYQTMLNLECEPANSLTGSDSILIDGNYSGLCKLTIEAVDYAANTASTVTENAVEISIDNEAPVMSMFSISGRAEYHPAASEVCIYDAYDGYSGLSMAYLIADDGSEFSEAIEENGQVCIAYQLPEGKHTVQFKLADKAGNESELSEEFEMFIDNRAPVVRFISAPSVYRPSEKTIVYKGNASDPDSGIETLEYSLDGGDTYEEIEADAEGGFSITVKPEPRATVIVRAKDKVGNEAIIESEPLQQISDASSRLAVAPVTVANMLIKPYIIDYDGSISEDFAGIASARAFVYGRGYDHALIELSAANNYAFMWDGYFPTDVKAPSGWYWLTVEFTDLLGNVECYNSRIRVDWDEPEPEVSVPQYRTFDISGTVNEMDKVSVTVNGSRYMLADFSKVGAGISQGARVTGTGRAYTKENVLVIETLEQIPDEQLPFNGLIDDIGNDYVIIDGHALVIDENTKFYCDDTRVGDYVSGLYTADSLNRMYVTEFGPLSCERDVITRVDSGIVN